MHVPHCCNGVTGTAAPERVTTDRQERTTPTAKPTQAISEGPGQSSVGWRRHWSPPTPMSHSFWLRVPRCFLTPHPTKGLPALAFNLCRLSLRRPPTAADTAVGGFGIFPVPSLSRAMSLSRSHQGGIVAAAQPRAEGVCSRMKVAKSSTPILCFCHMK